MQSFHEMIMSWDSRWAISVCMFVFEECSMWRPCFFAMSSRIIVLVALVSARALNWQACPAVLSHNSTLGSIPCPIEFAVLADLCWGSPGDLAILCFLSCIPSSSGFLSRSMGTVCCGFSTFFRCASRIICGIFSCLILVVGLSLPVPIVVPLHLTCLLFLSCVPTCTPVP